LEQKLFLIERNYENNRQKDSSNIELRLLRFKKDLQRRIENDKEAEIRRFKEFQLSNMRIEESEKYRQKMEKYREELSEVHMTRL